MRMLLLCSRVPGYFYQDHWQPNQSLELMPRPSGSAQLRQTVLPLKDFVGKMKASKYSVLLFHITALAVPFLALIFAVPWVTRGCQSPCMIPQWQRYILLALVSPGASMVFGILCGALTPLRGKYSRYLSSFFLGSLLSSLVLLTSVSYCGECINIF